jgi:hypothetical protein
MDEAPISFESMARTSAVVEIPQLQVGPIWTWSDVVTYNPLWLVLGALIVAAVIGFVGRMFNWHKPKE